MEESIDRTAVCPRKLARDVLYIMAGIKGLTIVDRADLNGGEEKLYYNCDDEAEKALEFVTKNSFYLAGNVTFGKAE